MAKAKDLVIVESPAKAKTIEKYLGSGYKVTASMGHLRDLPKSKMGVDIENGFEPQYIPVRDKKELIAELKKEAKRAPVWSISPLTLIERARPYRGILRSCSTCRTIKRGG